MLLDAHAVAMMTMVGARTDWIFKANSITTLRLSIAVGIDIDKGRGRRHRHDVDQSTMDPLIGFGSLLDERQAKRLAESVRKLYCFLSHSRTGTTAACMHRSDYCHVGIATAGVGDRTAQTYVRGHFFRTSDHNNAHGTGGGLVGYRT